jgi:hypothetical protein
MGVPEMVAALTLIITHPITRWVRSVMSTIADVAAITLLAKKSKVFRYLLLGLVMSVCVFVLSGCSAPKTITDDEGRVIQTNESSPVSGVYCYDELVTYRSLLVKALQCAEDCDMPEFAEAARDYTSCAEEESSDRTILNPFNRIRDL